MSHSYPQKVHEDVQKYVRGKRIDALVSALLEEIIKHRPNFVATFIICYMFANHKEDASAALFASDVQTLSKRLNSNLHFTDYELAGYHPGPKDDVQADLERYLQEQSVQPMLTALVEKLILSDSANPYATIVETICKEFPEQALRGLDLVSPSKQPAGGKTDFVNVLNMTDAADSISVDSSESYLDDEDDEDEEGEQASLATETSSTSPSLKERLTRRRLAVSAESMDPLRVKEVIAQFSLQVKEGESLRRLLVLVNKSSMLKRLLDPEERAWIVKAFQGPLNIEAGTDIIRQGEEGDKLYLVDQGSVEVFVQPKEGEPVKVQTCSEGDTFGQLALMYNAPRAATCRAVTNCALWSLERTAFKAILVAASLRRREQLVDFLNQVPLLSTLTSMEKMMLADSLREERFEDGQVVCRQGDAGDSFYVILDGQVECFQQGSTGGKSVNRLVSGQCFGDAALLTAKPRQITAKAKGALRVSWTDRNTFNRLLGPLEDLLRRDEAIYSKYCLSK
eukprot:gene3662-4007_t